jgi:hypothetical protein
MRARTIYGLAVGVVLEGVLQYLHALADIQDLLDIFIAEN